MRPRIPVLLFFGTTAISAAGQVIPADRITAWDHAGLMVDPPEATLVLDITDLGGVGDGSSPNDAALLAAFAAAEAQATVVYFPPGNYLFNAAVDMPDSVVLRGAGADSTSLTFALGGTDHCIKIAGAEMLEHHPIIASAARGSSHLSLSSTTGLLPGGTVRLYREDSALVESWWAEGAAGQLARIAAVQPDGIDLAAPLRAHYPVGESTYLAPMRPALASGIECLRVVRTDATAGQFSNIWLYAAQDCWVRGVESVNCNFAHIELYTSTNCLVEGNWLHHAFNYGSGGQGYGVLAYLTAGENLVVDNIFEHTRHAMLIEAGANGNVFAYNHSIDPYWEEGFFPPNSAGDIVLHGDHPYLNLFEGNIVQNIVVDDSHGKNGPFNTLFRNRADLWGLLMNNGPASDSLNIVGNDITGTPPTGLWVINGVGHFLYGNLVQNEVTPPGTDDLTEPSYYASSEPAFLQLTGTWPQTGPNHAQPGTLPAVQRYLGGGDRTRCAEVITATPQRTMNDGWRAYPVPFSDRLFVEGPAGPNAPLRADLFNITGAVVATAIQDRQESGRVTISTSGLSSGAYVLSMEDRTGRAVRILVVKE